MSSNRVRDLVLTESCFVSDVRLGCSSAGYESPLYYAWTLELLFQNAGFSLFHLLFG